MSKDFDNWESFEQEINKRINQSLKQNVSKEIKTELIHQANVDVYSSYDPVEYDRRGNAGGLIDSSNIKSEAEDDELTVWDAASLEGPRLPVYTSYEENNLAGLIEHGAYNPWGRTNRVWTRPRPFVTNIKEKIANHPKTILQILQDDIEK